MDRTKDILLKELENWQGVEFCIEEGGKHRRLRLTRGDTSRFLTFSETRVDRRGMLNRKSDLKRLLTALGAERR